MGNERWKVGIAGCGRIAGVLDSPRPAGPVTTHAQAYHCHPDFALVAAVNPDAAALQQFQTTWNVPCGYSSVEQMLAGEPLDVVDICSPDALHFAHAAAILTAPWKPRLLLVEKPVCLNPAEFRRLQELAAAAQVMVMVNHTRRFDPGHRRLAEWVRAGRWGRLLQGRCTYYGGWLHNGPHLIDTLRLLFEPQIQVVSARISTHAASGPASCTLMDLEAELRVGDAGVTIAAFPEHYYQLFESEFRFESGRTGLLDFGARIQMEEVLVNGLGERELVPLAESPLHGLVSPMLGAVAAIAECLAGRNCLAELGVDLNSARETMAVLWRALEMAAAAGGMANEQRGGRG